MRRVKEIEIQRACASTPPPHTRYFASSASSRRRDSDSDWIIGLLEHEDVSTSSSNINNIDPMLQSNTLHAIHKSKWFIHRHNHYKQSPPSTPSSPVHKNIRRSSSTSQLDVKYLQDTNYLTFNSKPKWWSITKLHKAKPVQSEPIDIKKLGQKNHHGTGHAHSLQNIKHKFSSRFNLLKRSLSNRLVFKRQSTNDVVSRVSFDTVKTQKTAQLKMITRHDQCPLSTTVLCSQRLMFLFFFLFYF